MFYRIIFSRKLSFHYYIIIIKEHFFSLTLQTGFIIIITAFVTIHTLSHETYFLINSKPIALVGIHLLRFLFLCNYFFSLRCNKSSKANVKIVEGVGGKSKIQKSRVYKAGLKRINPYRARMSQARSGQASNEFFTTFFFNPFSVKTTPVIYNHSSYAVGVRVNVGLSSVGYECGHRKRFMSLVAAMTV